MRPVRGQNVTDGNCLLVGESMYIVLVPVASGCVNFVMGVDKISYIIQ